MAVEVKGPWRAALFAAEPVFRRLAQRGQQVLLDIPMPRQDLPRRSVAPALIDQVIVVVRHESVLLGWPALLAGDTGRVRLPVGDMDQCVFYGPGILALRPGHWPVPLLVPKP